MLSTRSIHTPWNFTDVPMTAVTCAPCVLEVASSEVITFPTPIVATVPVSIVPHIMLSNGTHVTRLATTTLYESATGVQDATRTSHIIDITDSAQLDWSTLGTVLRYPTTYIHYQHFIAATVDSSAGCAATASPTTLELPHSTNAASFIYPASQGGFPSAMLTYIMQIQSMTSCSAIKHPVLAHTKDQSSATDLSQPTERSTLTPLETGIPRPTLFTNDISRKPINPINVRYTSARIFRTVTAPPVVHAPSELTIASKDSSSSALNITLCSMTDTSSLPRLHQLGNTSAAPALTQENNVSTATARVTATTAAITTPRGLSITSASAPSPEGFSTVSTPPPVQGSGSNSDRSRLLVGVMAFSIGIALSEIV